MTTNEEKIKRGTQEGDYREEVTNIVGSIIKRIKDGDLKSQEQVDDEIGDYLNQSIYLNNDDLCVHVIMCSHFPTAFFSENSRNSCLDDDFTRYRWTGTGPVLNYKTKVPWDAGRKEFPWRSMAYDAMKADIKEVLTQDKCYRVLRDYEEAEEEEDNDGQEEGGTEE